MADPVSRPTVPNPSDPDFADQATDAVVRVVEAVRDRTTGPVLTAARAIVYGIIGAFAALVALILLTIALVRVIDVYLPGGVWAADLLLGVVFLFLGWLVWRKRYAPTPA